MPVPTYSGPSRRSVKAVQRGPETTVDEKICCAIVTGYSKLSYYMTPSQRHVGTSIHTLLPAGVN